MASHKLVAQPRLMLSRKTLLAVQKRIAICLSLRTLYIFPLALIQIAHIMFHKLRDKSSYHRVDT